MIVTDSRAYGVLRLVAARREPEKDGILRKIALA